MFFSLNIILFVYLQDMYLEDEAKCETNIRLAFESSDDEAEQRGQDIKRGRKKTKRLLGALQTLI